MWHQAKKYTYIEFKENYVYIMSTRVFIYHTILTMDSKANLTDKVGMKSEIFEKQVNKIKIIE